MTAARETGNVPGVTDNGPGDAGAGAKTSVRVVREAVTAMASFFLVSRRRWTSRWRILARWGRDQPSSLSVNGPQSRHAAGGKILGHRPGRAAQSSAGRAPRVLPT